MVIRTGPINLETLIRELDLPQNKHPVKPYDRHWVLRIAIAETSFPYLVAVSEPAFTDAEGEPVSAFVASFCPRGDSPCRAFSPACRAAGAIGLTGNGGLVFSIPGSRIEGTEETGTGRIAGFRTGTTGGSMPRPSIGRRSIPSVWLPVMGAKENRL